MGDELGIYREAKAEGCAPRVMRRDKEIRSEVRKWYESYVLKKVKQQQHALVYFSRSLPNVGTLVLSV